MNDTKSVRGDIVSSIQISLQAALLKLRERALKEKTQAELAWIEAQKNRMRDKGADDAYPKLQKKKRGLLMRLQAEQVGAAT